MPEAGVGPLGRVVPPNWRHVEKYPLRAIPVSERPTSVPVVIGVNWHTAFDGPGLIERKGRNGRTEWWVRDDITRLGRVRGGHCVVLEPVGPASVRDLVAWWIWYNQVKEGICVSEGVCRMMSLLNRKRYQPRPVYDEAQLRDVWPGEDYDGTSVRAGLQVAHELGLIPARAKEPHFVRKGEVIRAFSPQEGIGSYHWATDIDQVFAVLGNPDGEFSPWLNSWGRDGYPQRVRVPRRVLEHLLNSDGEFGLVVDK